MKKDYFGNEIFYMNFSFSRLVVILSNVVKVGNSSTYYSLMFLGLLLPAYWFVVFFKHQGSFFIGSILAWMAMVLKTPPYPPSGDVQNEHHRSRIAVALGMLAVTLISIIDELGGVIEVTIGFVSTAMTAVFWYYSVSAMEIARNEQKGRTILEITKHRLFHDQTYQFMLSHSEVVKLVLQKPPAMFHKLQVNGREVDIAPSTSQDLGVVADLLELLEGLRLEINELFPKRYRTIELPRAKNPTVVNLEETDISRQLTELQGNGDFHQKKDNINLENIIAVLLSVMLTATLSIIMIAVPLIKSVQLLEENDGEYIIWELFILVGIGFAAFMVQILMVEIRTTFGRQSIRDTTYNIIMEYKLPWLSPFRIVIPKRLNPQIEIVHDRKGQEMVHLTLYGKNNKKYYSVTIGKICH
ncbi:MAG: hypothetical protein D6732_06285 [Methanobacteriota archaeon]|nr:MAG: hypothetical protein D6732_06285 [Euryarchaeota archaeon]